MGSAGDSHSQVFSLAPEILQGSQTWMLGANLPMIEREAQSRRSLLTISRAGEVQQITPSQSRRCLLTISRTGEVQQITLLAAVHLTRADGRLLVQLGQVRDGSIEITGVPPGRRLQGGRVGPPATASPKSST